MELGDYETHYGTCDVKEGRYTGMLLELRDAPHGVGQLEYLDGRRYSGHFYLGKCHGTGVMEWHGSSEMQRCASEWEKGQPQGRALVLYQSGDEYKGMVRQGKPHGQGVLRSTDGGLYEGYWKDGLCHGYGLEVNQHGDAYIGLWKEGVYHGMGELHLKDGTKLIGVFAHGSLASHAVQYNGEKLHFGAFSGKGELKRGISMDKKRLVSMYKSDQEMIELDSGHAKLVSKFDMSSSLDAIESVLFDLKDPFFGELQEMMDGKDTFETEMKIQKTLHNTVDLENTDDESDLEDEEEEDDSFIVPDDASLEEEAASSSVQILSSDESARASVEHVPADRSKKRRRTVIESDSD